MPTAPRLVMLDGITTLTDRQSQAVPLESYPFTIGRARDCHLIIDHSQVSRLHSCLEYDHEQVVITDLNSTNGTFVNGERLTPNQPHRLRAGDRINIAQVCTIEFDDPGTTVQMLPVEVPTMGLALDEDGAQVIINGRKLDPPLSPSQFLLLTLLVEHDGHIVTREEMRDYVWGPDEEVTDQTIDALVSRLRRRLDEIDPDHQYVVTRRGFGLAFRNKPFSRPQAEDYL
ncbi:MAG: FHA domain-containing protein [Chloroflexota bacterium]